jgi:2-dehydro-3-deoxygalactonokinase
LDWVAVDWGTSNLRAWGIAANGAVLFEHDSPKGMGKLTREEFAPALLEVLGPAAEARNGELQVLICGMAGAKQGWLEAPYLEAPVDLRGLLADAVRPSMPKANIAPAILPGVCQKAGDENVMRGEETQLLGLAALNPGFNGLVCMPGTHSKWALLSETRIEHFSTAMTGEMFEVLRTHSVLRHSLAGDFDGPARAEGFAAGAADGLIGTEIGSNRHLLGGEPVPLIGSATLSSLYQEVLAMIGVQGTPQDAKETVLAGLKAARGFTV